MNWNRVRQDKIMSAVASSDRIAEAAGATPPRHEDLPPGGPLALEPTLPAQQARRLKKLEAQIGSLRGRVRKADRRGDHKTAKKLAREALALLDKNGIKNLTPDRLFFQKVLYGTAQEAHRIAVAKTGKHQKSRRQVLLKHVYVSELRNSVQAAGGIFTPTGKSIKVTTFKGSVQFPVEKLVESDTARRELRRRITRVTGLRLASLAW